MPIGVPCGNCVGRSKTRVSYHILTDITHCILFNSDCFFSPKYAGHHVAQGYCPLGSNFELSQHILGYIQEPRQLYRLSMVNKLLRSCISVEMVVKSSLYHGGYAMKSVQNLAVLMLKKAIYPPSAMRLLRLANGKRCEFCLNAPISPSRNRGLLFQFKQNVNPLPRFVRPTCGFFACWNCMEQWRHPDISGSWKYPCITRKWYKLFFNPSTGQYHHKQFYLCHRELFRSIQSHERVVSYPYGRRWLFRTEDGMLVPTTF